MVWMNEWNEWMNEWCEWMNKWMNKWNAWIHEWIKNGWNEWITSVDEWIECINDVNEWMDWTNEWNDWMKWINKRTDKTTNHMMRYQSTMMIYEDHHWGLMMVNDDVHEMRYEKELLGGGSWRGC